MTGLPRAYNERMTELGFSTYVFIERIAANATALHPFPEHNVALVRAALADAGFDITLLGPDAPEVGEGVYFQPEPFGDEVIGLLADALTLRGIGAYGYALVDSSLGGELADIALFMRVGDVFPRHGRRILMTRMYIQRTPTGAGNKAVTWAFGSPADLEEANRLLSERFDTEPVTDPRGMAAIEIRHPRRDFPGAGRRRLRGHYDVQRSGPAPGLTHATRAAARSSLVVRRPFTVYSRRTNTGSAARSRAGFLLCTLMYPRDTSGHNSANVGQHSSFSLGDANHPVTRRFQQTTVIALFTSEPALTLLGSRAGLLFRGTDV